MPKHYLRRKKYAVLACCLALILSVGAIARTPYGTSLIRHYFGPPAPPIPAATNPSKEYIYAGNKLIATEAPVSLLAPGTLSALTLSNLPSPQVSVNWSATTGAHHYELEKTANLNQAYQPVATNITGTNFTDTNVTSVTAYLYRVRAVDANGNSSAYSNIDIATAISFTDDTITSQTTPVRGAHITELRQAVDAMRTTLNLSTVDWGGSIIPSSTEIQATHIQDLRTYVNQARAALNLSPCSFSDNSLTELRASFIKKDHIEEIRQCVR
ncbi:MAG TPA: fibronectin type III domain-containing protein [Pyrinomonadaceae bacterium]|nr:fibronectin type III domain-containing protein [Pyrinomonadaceae bacterium]